MAESLYELLNRCTVRIVGPTTQEQGTGFFVAPGQIVTCAHVVKEVPSGTLVPLFWRAQQDQPFRELRAQISLRAEAQDMAWLSLDDPPAHPCVWLAEESAAPFQELYSFGYPMHLASGGTSVRFTCEGWTERDEQTLLTLTDGQVVPGMSGAPVLSPQTGLVCGILAITRDQGSNLGGRAILTRTLWQVFPALREAQATWKRQDQRWRVRLPKPDPTIFTPRDLPPRVPDFVGRAQEVQRLCDALRQGQNVALAVAVSGMGGVGKSALAFESVHVLAQDPNAFPGGITWVRCDERRDLSGLVWVYNRLLSAWNITLTREERESATTLEAEAELRERALHTRLRPEGTEPRPPALVLLDNVEREWPLGRALEVLAALKIAVLLTTRTEFHLPRLRLVKLDVLEAAAALALFQQRYIDLGGEWSAARDEAPAAAMVKMLGYLPLAIDLAAPPAVERGCAPLAREMQHSGGLGPLEDPLDSQHSVRFLFHKSLDTLTATQLARFRALGLPAGPDWPRPVIEKMLSAVVVPPEAAAPASTDLSLLARLSLVKLVPAAAPTEEPRVRLHPLLRELAREEWKEWMRQSDSPQRATLQGLLTGVSELVATHKHDFAALEREEELITETLRQVKPTHRAQFADLIVTLCLGMHAFWLSRGRTEEMLRYLPWGISSAKTLARRTGQSEDRLHLAELAYAYGQALFIRGRYQHAEQHFHISLEIRKQEQNLHGEAEVLTSLGQTAQQLGQFREAKRSLMTALSKYRTVADPHGEVTCLRSLGWLAYQRGLTNQAEAFLRNAVELAQQLEDHTIEDYTAMGSASLLLGSILLEYRSVQAAYPFLKEALAIFREKTFDRWREGKALISLGNSARLSGQVQEAEHYLHESLVNVRAIHNPPDEGVALEHLGLIALQRGHLKEAEQFVLEANTKYRQAESVQNANQLLTTRGLIALQRGHLARAEKWLQASFQKCTKDKDQQGMGLALEGLGRLAERRREFDTAKAHFQQSRTLAAQVKDRELEVWSLTDLGRMAWKEGQLAEAKGCLRTALTRSRAAGYLREQGVVSFWLGSVEEAHGHLRQAEHWYAQSLEISQQVESARDMVTAQLRYGWFLIDRRGRRDQGCRLLQQAVETCREQGLRLEQEDKHILQQANCRI